MLYCSRTFPSLATETIANAFCKYTKVWWISNCLADLFSALFKANSLYFYTTLRSRMSLLYRLLSVFIYATIVIAVHLISLLVDR